MQIHIITYDTTVLLAKTAKLFILFKISGKIHEKKLFLAIIKIPNSHKFWMCRQIHQLIDGDHRSVCGTHRMRTGGIEHRRMGLGERTDLWFVFQLCANRDHTRNPCGRSPRYDFGVLAVEVCKIEVAVAVRDVRRICHGALLGAGLLL